MSYIKLSGVGDEVSGEKIVYGLNAQGLACTGMSISREGGNKVITFELADGEGASYRKSQTGPNLLIKIADALERAGVFITGPLAGSGRQQALKTFSLELGGKSPAILFNDQDMEQNFSGAVATIKPPQSSPPYGSFEWAKLILPDEVY